jgi:hypothetical protein
VDAAPAPDFSDPLSAIAGYAAYEAGISRIQADAKRAAARFAGITCSCAPWFAWDDRTPPQAACGLHGNILITADGLII